MQDDSSQSEEIGSWVDDHSKTNIALFSTDRKAHEAGLAVLAAGGHYWVYPFEGKFALVVASSEAARLKNEVRLFRMKNRFWPTVFPALAEKKISVLPTYLFAGFLIAVFYLQGSFPKLDDLGMNSSTEFWQNDAWWRIVTAATLHADLGHLVGNLFGIVLFGYFAARYLGNGLGWIGILFAAAMANLTNSLIHFESAFNSLGASTAVFGALGLVTGFPIGSFLKTGNKITNRQWLVPLAGGLMLLAWLGSGNFPTDVAGHFWAFLFGLGAAIAISRIGIQSKLRNRDQSILLIIFWFILLICWSLALT